MNFCLIFSNLQQGGGRLVVVVVEEALLPPVLHLLLEFLEPLLEGVVFGDGDRGLPELVPRPHPMLLHPGHRVPDVVLARLALEPVLHEGDEERVEVFHFWSRIIDNLFVNFR